MGERFLPSEECSFCDIVAGTEPARVVLDSLGVLAFFPKEPVTIGHTLVVPRKHIADLWSVDPGTAQALSHATLAVAHAVRSVFAPEGLNIIQSNGEAATQTVRHLHVHVLPRWRGDAMGPIWPDARQQDETSLDEAAAALHRAIREL
jgi:histidine triad (HIT) family protein